MTFNDDMKKFCPIMVIGIIGSILSANLGVSFVLAQTSPSTENITSNTSFSQNTSRPDTNEQINPTSSLNKSNENAVQFDTDYQSIRDAYLQQWDQLDFGSSFDTFITSDIGPDDIKYGYYDARLSSSFSPESEIVLYVQPVGYKFGEAVDNIGNILNMVNITSFLQVSNKAGEVLLELDFETLPFTSHEKRTEIFYTLPVKFGQDTGPLPLGDYIFKYRFVDGISGNTFDIDKNVKIAQSIQ